MYYCDKCEKPTKIRVVLCEECYNDLSEEIDYYRKTPKEKELKAMRMALNKEHNETIEFYSYIKQELWKHINKSPTKIKSKEEAKFYYTIINKIDKHLEKVCKKLKDKEDEQYKPGLYPVITMPRIVHKC